MVFLSKIYKKIILFSKVKFKLIYDIWPSKIKGCYHWVKTNIKAFDFKKIKAKTVATKSFAMMLVFGVLMSTVIFFPSTKVSALEVKYENKTVGYVKDKTKIDKVKSEISGNVEGNNVTNITDKAEKILDKKIKTKPIKIEREDIDNNVNSLKESIVEASDDFDEGYGVFVGDELCFT